MIVRRGLFRPGRRVRVTGFCVAVVLLGSAQSAAGARAAPGWHGLGWDLPPLQQTQSVDGVDGGFRPAADTSPKSVTPPRVVWPAAASAEAELPATTAGAKAPAAKAVAGEPVAIARGLGGERRRPRGGGPP